MVIRQILKLGTLQYAFIRLNSILYIYSSLYSLMKKEIRIGYDYFDNHSTFTETERLLFEKANAVRKGAYAPYSKFLVGCAILLENGEVITGNNQENAAFPSGICAERAAIFWTAGNHPGAKISKIFVVGGPESAEGKVVPVPPCGACRQSILEYENLQKAGIEVYFASTAGECFKVDSLKDLLPFSFGAEFL